MILGVIHRLAKTLALSDKHDQASNRGKSAQLDLA